jgi:Predicted AAA-ATPase/PD-(D/E)XK nuclease superfamily
MKKLPIDVSTFATIVNEDYIYVDKTECIYNLITNGRYYFLSRPRRFGKTLLVSTLKELFLGNTNLFSTFWIGASNYSWPKHPVIHLDFSTIPHLDEVELRASTNNVLNDIAHEYKLSITRDTPEETLRTLVRTLAEKNKVVILIDEYDKPILDHLHNIECAQAQRTVLRSFYDTIKGLDHYLRAVFITGVSKFAKTSLFSGINNLNDISEDQIAAQLLGYTQEEINTYFLEYIQDVAEQYDKAPQEINEEMKAWYNGYRFSEKDIRVYNPFSVLYYLKKKKRANYWFESGTPSFLVKLLEKDPTILHNIEHKVFSSSTLGGTFEVEKIPLITLLYQTGYLTIKDYDQEHNMYTLGYANEEVRLSISIILVSILTRSESSTIENSIFRLKSALTHNNIDAFCTELKILLAHIPYTLHISRESYYYSLLQLMLSLLDMNAQSEILTDKGRIDLTLETKTHLYIFELKFNTKAIAALQQIETKKYYQRYLTQKKGIILIGLSFNYNQDKLTLDCQTKHLNPL